MAERTLMERAFELAQSGKIGSLDELRAKLHAEGFVESRAQISGPALQRQLRDLMRTAHGMEPLNLVNRRTVRKARAVNKASGRQTAAQ